MLTFLSEFTTYLNDLGYECGVNQAMIAERVICDLKNPDEIGTALKSIYAKDPQEYHSFEYDFRDFYKNRENRLKAIEKKKRKEELREKQKLLEERHSRLKSEQEILEKKEKEIREKYQKRRVSLKQQKEKSFQEHILELRKQKALTNADENFLLKNESYLKDHPLEKALKGMEEVTDQLLKKLQAKAEQALLNGDLDTFEKDNKIFNISRKLLTKDDSVIRKAKISINKEFADQEKKLLLDEEAEIIELWRESKEEERRLYNEEDKISRAIHTLELEEIKLIQKTSSKNHRETFIGGKNAVQSADEGELSKSFERLTTTEIEHIQETIHQESVKLKTRLRKVSRTNRRENVDLRRTIRTSIRTGGEITKLLYRKKKPSKADMVLMLDISGSCSKAAKMLIGFAYALKDAFPNGTRVYAFVNRIYDITEIMNADNVTEATQAVFNTIPTRGVYSDYYVPLESFWKCEKNRLSRESFVMIMGDARNNRNPTGEYYMKQIQRKCSHSYFLCTEDEYQWGTGDSIADLYAKIIKTIPVTNTNELLGFINSVV